MADQPLRLFLFTADFDTARRAEEAGIDSVIVDWERHGKHARQNGHDTEINDHSVEAVSTLSARLQIPVTVRVNPLHSDTAIEIQKALDGGASVLMLPMAARPREVDTFVRLVGDRAKTLIQIETQQLADQCASLHGDGRRRIAFLTVFLSSWPAWAPRTRKQFQSLFLRFFPARLFLDFLLRNPFHLLRWRLGLTSVRRAARRRWRRLRGQFRRNYRALTPG